MENKSLLKVIAVSEAKTDKNGREFCMVTVQNPLFKSVTDEVTGEINIVLTPALKGTHTAYTESYLDDTKEWLANAKVGMVIEGHVEKRPVDSYEFVGRDGENRVANTYTSVVFGDTSAENWEEIVKATFRRNGHPVIGDLIAIALKAKATAPEAKEKRKVDITAGAKATVTAPVAAPVDQF